MLSCAVQDEANRRETEHAFGAQATQRLAASFGKNQLGYTMMELITVMIIIGILAVTALPRFFDANMFRDRGTSDQVMAALRYGQKVAIAQRRTAGVTVTITSAANSNCGAILNSTGNVDCVIASGVAIDKTLPWAVTFDALGRPGAAAALVVGGTTITIEAETGYVH